MVPDIQQQLQQQQLLMSLNQCYQQMAMQQMEIQNMQRQMQALYYSYSENPDDSGLSSDLRIRSMPSLFSPMVPRPSPPSDAFMFNPVLSPREPGQRATSERLLRSTLGEDSVFDSDKPFQRSEPAGDRNLKYSRMSKSDSYAKKKKTSAASLTNAGQRVSSASAQTRADNADRGSQTRESGPVPPLQFEQFLARKKRYCN